VRRVPLISTEHAVTEGGPGRPSLFWALGLVAALALAGGCASGAKGAAAPAKLPPDGSSLERAVPILEGTEAAGIAAERAWLKEHYPAAKKTLGGLQADGGRHYDVVVLRLPDDSEKTIYFDITAFFGF